MEIFLRDFGRPEIILEMAFACRQSAETIIPVLMGFIARHRLMKVFFSEGGLRRISGGNQRIIPNNRFLELVDLGLVYRLCTSLRPVLDPIQCLAATCIIAKTPSLLDVHDQGEDHTLVDKWLTNPNLRFSATEIHWSIDARPWAEESVGTGRQYLDFAQRLERYTKLLARSAPFCTQFSLRIHYHPEYLPSPASYDRYHYHLPPNTQSFRFTSTNIHSSMPFFYRDSQRVVCIRRPTHGGFQALSPVHDSYTVPQLAN